MEDRTTRPHDVAEAGWQLTRLLDGFLTRRVVAGELYDDAATRLLDAVRDGGVPVELANGAAFFDHLRAHPASPACSTTGTTRMHAASSPRAEKRWRPVAGS